VFEIFLTLLLVLLTASDIISNAIDFSERTVKQVFVPRTQLVAIDIDNFSDKILEQVIEDGFSRIRWARGIITMEDILKELVGEIQDEFDNELPFVEKSGEGLYKVLASASVSDISEHLPHPIVPDEEYETLAACLILQFGRFPEPGDQLAFDNYEFTVLKKARNSIGLVQLRDLVAPNP
jgi:CBS domain containing-hemolysin-like protein